jgi:putative SOS response-associated peptidase YedK
VFQEATMCGRLAQYRDAERYFELLRANPAAPFAPAPFAHAPVYNVSPGTHPMIIQAGGDGPEAGEARWGYRGRAPRMYVNARVESAATSGYWRPLWERGRILVPADGWFEWTGDKPNRQPHFIHRADDEPLLLAAILGSDGFAIVTSSADAGLLDVHDRRPVALTADGAQAWLAPETSSEDALLVTATQALGEAAFAWHAVTRAMGNVKYQAADAVAPLGEDAPQPAG